MADLTGFNANEFSDDAFTIEEGDYLVALVSSELKPTKKDPSVAYLYLQFEILEGKYQKRKIEERLNIKHADDQVRQIALQQLSGLCKKIAGKDPNLTHLLHPKDSSELHNKPVGLIVKVKPNEYQGEKRMQNSISGFLTKEEYATRKAAKATTTTAPPAWMKKDN